MSTGGKPTNARRFLGLELGGSRRTAVVAIDYFPAEGKVFLAESAIHLHGTKDETADEALVRTVNRLEPDLISVDAPLTFPPCLTCELGDCPGAFACPKESVKWMREESERRRWSKAKFPPPYTHRPVDLLMRGKWQEDAPLPLPSDEAFGSSRAPLAARISYLRRLFACKKLLESNPRFAMAGIADWYNVSTRELRRCRDMEYGAENRFTILNKLAERSSVPGLPHVFLYMTDVVGLSKELSAFDALLCALMGLFSTLDLLEPNELPAEWGSLARPRSLRALRGAKGASWGDT
jgi:hypothetical protein